MLYAQIVAAKRQESSPVARPKGKAAPDALRKRVLANVKAEPEPRRVRLAHAVNRRLGGHAGLLVGVLFGLGALIAVTGMTNPLGESSERLGRTSLAAEFRGAHATLRRAGNRAELTLSGMPQAPVGEVYEVWLSRRGGAPQPTDALFTPTMAGRGSVEVPGSLSRIHEVTVTREPVGGSSRPTSPIVLRVLLGRDPP
jgi:hypothetical protein